MIISSNEHPSRRGRPKILQLLEQQFFSPVDVEFTLQIPDPLSYPPEVKISLLQCRPQSSLKNTYQVHLPENLNDDEIVFPLISSFRKVIYPISAT